MLTNTDRVHRSSSLQEVLEEFNQYCRRNLPEDLSEGFISSKFNFAKCQSCSNFTVWFQKGMIYPRSSSFPSPNEDMNDEIKELYLEATMIFQDSPRASAALLRLCVEKLCEQLGEKGKLNTRIGNLVKKGLDIQIQQALDYCRVIGNNAIHAGEIDLEEDLNIVPTLFDLVNLVAQEMITKPKEINELFLSLPEESKKQVEQRDNN